MTTTVEASTFNLNSRHYRWTIVFAVLMLLLASIIPIWAGLQTRTPTDDAFITMVYARSIANDQGFRFYPTAPQTLGTTTPLQTMLLALLWKLFPYVSPEGSVIGLSVFWWIISGWLLAWQGQALGFTRVEAFCAGVIVLLGALPNPIQYISMEIRLFTLLLTVCTILYAKKQFFWAGLSLGLLCLVRAEGVLFFGALVLYELLKLRNQPLLNQQSFVTLGKQAAFVLVGAFVVLSPWIVYALATFGTFIPDTLAAKSHQVQLGFVPFVPRFIHDFLALTFDLGTLPIGWLKISLWAMLGFIMAVIKSYQLRPYVILIIWAVAFFIGYALIGVPFYYWYIVPFTYVMLLFSGCGIAALSSLPANIFQRSSRRGSRTHNRLVWRAAIVGLLLVLAELEVTAVSSNVNFVDARFTSYTRISNWINTNTPAGSRIGFMEIGIIGWYSDRPVIDLLGLTEPQLIPYLASGSVVTSFQAAQPDYFIYNRIFNLVLDPIVATDYFTKHYQLVAQINGNDDATWPDTLIYKRII